MRCLACGLCRGAGPPRGRPCRAAVGSSRTEHEGSSGASDSHRGKRWGVWLWREGVTVAPLSSSPSISSPFVVLLPLFPSVLSTGCGPTAEYRAKICKKRSKGSGYCHAYSFLIVTTQHFNLDEGLGKAEKTFIGLDIYTCLGVVKDRSEQCGAVHTCVRVNETSAAGRRRSRPALDKLEPVEGQRHRTTHKGYFTSTR